MPPGALGVLGLPGPQERSLAGRALPTSGPGILLFERSPCSPGIIDHIALGGASLLRKAARAAAAGGGIAGEVAALVVAPGLTESDAARPALA